MGSGDPSGDQFSTRTATPAVRPDHGITGRLTAVRHEITTITVRLGPAALAEAVLAAEAAAVVSAAAAALVEAVSAVAAAEAASAEAEAASVEAVLAAEAAEAASAAEQLLMDRRPAEIPPDAFLLLKNLIPYTQRILFHCR